jgi:hypothetical protein
MQAVRTKRVTLYFVFNTYLGIRDTGSACYFPPLFYCRVPPQTTLPPNNKTSLRPLMYSLRSIVSLWRKESSPQVKFICSFVLYTHIHMLFCIVYALYCLLRSSAASNWRGHYFNCTVNGHFLKTETLKKEIEAFWTFWKWPPWRRTGLILLYRIYSFTRRRDETRRRQRRIPYIQYWLCTYTRHTLHTHKNHDEDTRRSVPVPDVRCLQDCTYIHHQNPQHDWHQAIKIAKMFMFMLMFVSSLCVVCCVEWYRLHGMVNR